MQKRYIILALVFIGLAFGLTLLPERQISEKTSPEELHQKIYDPARYLSTDDIAHRLINQDPSFLLIDVRSNSEYLDFSLPNSVSIPLKNLFNEENTVYMEQTGINAVFYSNADIVADQAWIIAKRLGYENIYVLKGGLNKWFSTIIQPQKPEETSPTEDFELYNFRIAASRYFIGDNGSIVSDNTKKKSVVIKRKKKKNVAEGGC